MELGTAPKSPAFHEQSGYLEKLNWPNVLIKAVHDEFMYALKLRTGECWFFCMAEYSNDEFVLLKMGTSFEINDFKSHSGLRGADARVFNYNITDLPEYDRGIEVRVSDIVWIIDAPFGS